MNRTRGFVNQNRFKSGRAIKQLDKVTYDKRKRKIGGKNKQTEKEITIYNFGA